MPQHRSPRHLVADHPALRGIALDDKTPPAKDSFSWRLWTACHDLAEAALGTKYIQGIKNGTLDPNNYGQYTVQDAVYCGNAADDYSVVEQRAQEAGEPSIAAFAKARHDSYVEYNKKNFADWHIADPSAIKLSDAAATYTEFERQVAHNAPPIYGVVMMIPCNQLWAWLAGQLAGDAGPHNLYNFWITGNDDWGGSYRLDNFIDEWHRAHPGVLDFGRALDVYGNAMLGELNFFRSACGEPIDQMPHSG